MAIKDPLLFITVDEFKTWKGFNKLEFDDTTTPDNEIWFAISIASNNIDYLSGFTISKKWPNLPLPDNDFINEIQTATANYVRFLLTKDSNYIRGQASISQGGLTYSENNSNDPYYIVPEVFNCLRKIKEYPNITGFNLDVRPKKYTFFAKFLSNCNEDSPLNKYLLINNIRSNDSRTIIKIEHLPNEERPVIIIDTNAISDASTKLDKPVNSKEGIEKFINDSRCFPELWAPFQFPDTKEWYVAPNPLAWDDLLTEFVSEHELPKGMLKTVAQTIVGAINEIYDMVKNV